MPGNRSGRGRGSRGTGGSRGRGRGGRGGGAGRGTGKGNKGRRGGGNREQPRKHLQSAEQDLESLQKAVLKLDREKRKIAKLIAKLAVLEDLERNGGTLDVNQMKLVQQGRKKRREHAQRIEELDDARNGLILSTTPHVRQLFGCCGNCGRDSHTTKNCPRPQSLAMKNQRAGFTTPTNRKKTSKETTQPKKIPKNCCQTCGSKTHVTKNCPRPTVLHESQKPGKRTTTTHSTFTKNKPSTTKTPAPASSTPHTPLAPAVEKHVLRPCHGKGSDVNLPRVLVVAEKPSVAKLIAQGLSNSGAMRTRHNPNGHAPMCKWHEIVTYFPPIQDVASIVITSVLGHLMSTDFVGKTDSQRPSSLFTTRVTKVIESTTKELGIVENLLDAAGGIVDEDDPGREAPKADFLYLWLDCDREGENICTEIVNVIRDRLGMFVNDTDSIYRAKFSALASSDVRRAWSKPNRINQHESDSVDVRQELDLKIGCSFTRLITRDVLDMARVKFEEELGFLNVMSYGPCQTPTLLFCTRRAKEIAKFVRRKFYYLTASGVFASSNTANTVNTVNTANTANTANTLPVPLQWVPDKTFHKQQALAALAIVQSPTSFSKIQQYRVKDRTQRPPTALNTVELLRAASLTLGLSPIRAMKAAEQLYMSGLMSYPRTESTRYPRSLPISELVTPHVNSLEWGQAASRILNGGYADTVLIRLLLLFYYQDIAVTGVTDVTAVIVTSVYYYSD